MTDSEIIRSLECCANGGDCKECKINPHKGNYGYCTSLAIKAALDLINRQKAEIERLESELTAMRNVEKSLKMHYEIAKNEAIKEFAERLKNRACCIPQHHFTYGEVEYHIDNLAKETGEGVTK